MKIGVDARLLALQLTGIGRYTVEMLRALQKSPIQLNLYTPDAPLGLNDWSSNVTLKQGTADSRWKRMLWSQTSLPQWAKRDDVDVFWGATHRLPLGLPRHIARVVSVHDLVWRHAAETMRPLSRFMEARLMPQAVSFADRIMADSQSTADDLVAEFPAARGKVHVVHLGATQLAAPEPASALQPLGVMRPYVLAVGTLEPRKNLVRLLEAFAALPDGARKQHQLVLVGGKGWGGVQLKEKVASLGLGGDVVVVGYVTDTLLATLYTHAVCLAMPSLYEGFGLPLVEAMSCGVPVLTSNVSSLPEVAGDAGLIVNPYSVGSISGGLLSLLTDENLRQSLALASTAQVRKFSWQRAAEQALEVFEQAKKDRAQMNRARLVDERG